MRPYLRVDYADLRQTALAHEMFLQAEVRRFHRRTGSPSLYIPKNISSRLIVTLREDPWPGRPLSADWRLQHWDSYCSKARADEQVQSFDGRSLEVCRLREGQNVEFVEICGVIGCALLPA